MRQPDVYQKEFSSPRLLENIRVMSSFKHQERNEGGVPPQPKGYNLWLYQLRGDRYYFRLAPLGLALLVIPVILALVALAVIFLYRTNRPLKETDIKITPPPESASPSTRTVLRPVPPPSPPPPVYRSNINSPNPIVTPRPDRNSNGQ